MHGALHTKDLFNKQRLYVYQESPVAIAIASY